MQLFAMETSEFGDTPSTLSPSDIIEGYHSLIWTERYLSESEFKLKTYNIVDMMAKLPIDMLVSHSTTDKIMIVETHSIDPDEQTGAPVLTISGRGYETFLENRVSIDNLTPEYGPGPTDVQNTWITLSSDAGNATAGIIAAVVLFGHTGTDDLMTGTGVYFTSGGSDADLNRQVPRQDLYTSARDFANAGGYGLKVVYDFTTPTQPAHIVVYKGTDKSDKVQLSVSAGHFVNPSYLWSNKGYKNVAYVFGRHSFREVYSPEFGTTLSDLERRVLFVNATDIQDVDSTDTQALLLSRGYQELAKTRKTFIFGGQASPSIPYKYGYNYKADYGLGDTILVIGDYGVKQLMLVTEYVLTEDETGEFGSPTLVQVDTTPPFFISG